MHTISTGSILEHGSPSQSLRTEAPPEAVDEKKKEKRKTLRKITTTYLHVTLHYCNSYLGHFFVFFTHTPPHSLDSLSAQQLNGSHKPQALRRH
jgi:hypothetical protein